MTGRVPLRDAAGRTLATYRLDQRRGRPCADLLEASPGVQLDEAVALAVAQLRGWIVGTGPQLAAGLLAAGGEELRRGELMLHDLGERAVLPPSPAGITIVPLAHAATDLRPAALLAYPEGHPDRVAESSDAQEAADMERILSGAVVGPVMCHSRVALDAGGGVVGAAIVTDDPAEPPFGGPWLADVFRHPEAAPPGTGAALIDAAIASLQAAGEESLGLVVTCGNPARHVYERLGFAVRGIYVTIGIGVLDSAQGV